MKRILAAALMVLFLTAGCGAADSPTVPASQDPSESQALSEQVKALAQEINELSETNDALAQEVRKLGEANASPANPAALPEQARKAPAPTQSQDQAEPAGRGICSRTPAVQKAVIGRLGIPSCSVITQDEMFRIEGDMSITHDSPLKPNDFAGMSNLKDLSLDLNCPHLQEEPLPAGVFRGLESLRSLQMDAEHPYCGAAEEGEGTTLPPGLFDGLPNLYELGLRDSDLASLPPGVFEGLTSLHTLDLSDNDLTSLPAGLFEGLTSLHTLDLSGNDLTSLPPGLFEGLTSLHTLDLSGNDLTSLPPEVFTNLTSLRRLDLNEKRDSVSGNSTPFEIEVANFGVAANLEGYGFVIVDKQQ